jgi:hypothetical protein
MARDPLQAGLNTGSGSSDPLGTGDFIKNMNAVSGSTGGRRSTLAQYQPTVDVGAGQGINLKPATSGGPVSSQSLQPAFNNQPTSGAPIAYQPVTGNSLDQQLRSVLNLLGGQGFNQYQAGQFTMGSGLNLLSQPTEFWQALLSGDPSANAFIRQAMQPTISSISDQYATAATTAAQNTPRGGYGATAQANLPYAQARDTANVYSQMAQLVPQAATQLASTGMDVSQLGLSESQMGLSQLFNMLQGVLSKAGMNTQQDMANMANLTSGLETVFSTLV